MGAGIAHLDIVQSIAFSPDSQRIATGGYRSIKIWKRKTSPEQILAGLSPAERVAAIAPSGKRIAYRSRQQGLVLVDLQTGQAHTFLKVHTAPITALVWTEDSARLISCDESGQWLLTNSGNYQTQPIVLPTNLVAESLVRVAADRLLGLSTDGDVFELQFTAEPSSPGAFVRLLEHAQAVTAIAVASDARRVAVALADGKIQLRDLDTWQVIRELDSSKQIRSLTLNRDGSLLLAIPVNEAAQIWKTDDGSLLAELDRDYAMAQQLQFASSGISRQKMLIDLLAKELPTLEKAAEQEVEARNKIAEARNKAAESLAAAKTARETADSGLSDVQQSLAQAEEALAAAKKQVDEMVAQVQANEKSVAEAADKQKAAEQELREREQALATASQSVERAQAAIPVFKDRIDTEKTRLTEMESSLTALEAQLDHQPLVTSATFSLEGSDAILACEDDTVRMYSLDGKPKANLTSPAQTLSLISSANGSLMGLSADGTVSDWDLNMGWELERTIGNYQDSPISDRVTALDFSPDGKLLAAGSGPPSRFGEIKLFDVQSGKIVLDLGEAHSDTVFGLEFSPDGSLLASASADKLCRLFDVNSGDMLRAFEGHTHHVLDVSWHENGQTLATASADATIKLWKGETGEQIRTIEGFPKEVTALTFLSPAKEGDASQIVSACADGVVRVHDAENGKQLKALSGTGDALYGVVASLGSQEVSAGGQGGRVWIWRLADAKLLNEIPPNSR